MVNFYGIHPGFLIICQDYLILILVCVLILVATGGSHALLLFTSDGKMQVALKDVRYPKSSKIHWFRELHFLCGPRKGLLRLMFF